MQGLSSNFQGELISQHCEEVLQFPSPTSHLSQEQSQNLILPESQETTLNNGVANFMHNNDLHTQYPVKACEGDDDDVDWSELQRSRRLNENSETSFAENSYSTSDTYNAVLDVPLSKAVQPTKSSRDTNRNKNVLNYVLKYFEVMVKKESETLLNNLDFIYSPQQFKEAYHKLGIPDGQFNSFKSGFSKSFEYFTFPPKTITLKNHQILSMISLEISHKLASEADSFENYLARSRMKASNKEILRSPRARQMLSDYIQNCYEKLISTVDPTQKEQVREVLKSINQSSLLEMEIKKEMKIIFDNNFFKTEYLEYKVPGVEPLFFQNNSTANISDDNADLSTAAYSSLTQNCFSEEQYD